MSEREAALDWLVNGEVGDSSRSLAAWMLGVPQSIVARPWDGDDCRRCVLLLERVPAWVDRLDDLAAAHPRWAASLPEIHRQLAERSTR